ILAAGFVPEQPRLAVGTGLQGDAVHAVVASIDDDAIFPDDRRAFDVVLGFVRPDDLLFAVAADVDADDAGVVGLVQPFAAHEVMAADDRRRKGGAIAR